MNIYASVSSKNHHLYGTPLSSLLEKKKKKTRSGFRFFLKNQSLLQEDQKNQSKENGLHRKLNHGASRRLT
jgi:hypothetical protein